MPITKNALIRYHTLDRCFGNPGRKYDIEALLDQCNRALQDLDAGSSGVKKRQLYEDIKFMQSEQGFGVELIKFKQGRSSFYRYEDTSFSIKNQPINQLEAEHLKSAMMVLSRFKGLPQFEWVNELLPKLDQTFSLNENSEGIISFETNPYLKGIERLDELFNAILYKRSLEIKYQSFKNPEPVCMVFFPYLLKQYNSRWFVLGRNKEYENITNLALDRIQDTIESKEPYIDSDINFDEYFEDVIGVTVNSEQPLIKIVLKVNSGLAPYIETKPLHESQKPMEHDEEHSIVRLELRPNFELEKLILSFGEQIEVISPLEFREKIKSRLIKNLGMYDQGNH